MNPGDVGLEVGLGSESKIINYWLENCERNHSECATSEDFLPTRLIDVGAAPDIVPRLIYSADKNIEGAHYLALSHCWGLTMPDSAKTTLLTISDRLKGIPIVGLSRTFADAIILARNLGVRYVWIDSLCIIQDSLEDWDKEAAQMASVYLNAYCTVSASGSGNGDGGCHIDSESLAYGPVTLKWDSSDETNGSQQESIRVFSRFGPYIVNVLQTDPLTQRGWCLQERELSRRVLHYSKDSVGIRWECRTVKASLQFPWEDSLCFNSSLRIFDAGQIRNVKGMGPLVTNRLKDQEAWFQTVQNYTKRSLTKKSDTLPAISGIARAIQARTNDVYFAGLWQSNLIACLLWDSALPQYHGTNGRRGIIAPPHSDISKHTHHRPNEYVAPTWSWASVTGPAYYEWWIFHDFPTSPDPRFVPTILEAMTVPTRSDPYGQLSGGFIRLSGKLRIASTKGEGFAEQDREGLYQIGVGKRIGSVRFDVPAEAPEGKPLLIKCLCVHPRSDNCGDTVGLALVPSGKGKGIYKRAGLVSAIKVEWWSSCEDEAVTIV